MPLNTAVIFLLSVFATFGWANRLIIFGLYLTKSRLFYDLVKAAIEISDRQEPTASSSGRIGPASMSTSALRVVSAVPKEIANDWSREANDQDRTGGTIGVTRDPECRSNTQIALPTDRFT